MRHARSGLLALVALLALIVAPPGAAALELCETQIVLDVELNAPDLELASDLVGTLATSEVVAAGELARTDAVEVSGLIDVTADRPERIQRKNEPTLRQVQLEPPLHRRGLR